MFHQGSPVLETTHAGYVLGGSREDEAPGNTPTGTYIPGISKSLQEVGIGGLHPVSVSCKNVNHYLLVLRCPPSVLWVLLNDRLDIVLDVFHLSPFIL